MASPNFWKLTSLGALVLGSLVSWGNASGFGGKLNCGMYQFNCGLYFVLLITATFCVSALMLWRGALATPVAARSRPYWKAVAVLLSIPAVVLLVTVLWYGSNYLFMWGSLVR